MSYKMLTAIVILITGANIGLGRESLHQLAKHNPSRIYLAARSRAKAETTISEINATLPDSAQSIVKFLECDLASFDSIKQAAKTFTSENERLDILMNNAGIMAAPPGTTKEGYEIQFGTNHVGHALLTKLLLPTLTRTAKSGPNGTGDVRIINLSSRSERFAPREGIRFNSLKSPDCGVGTWTRYGQSKLANILHANALAQKYPELTAVSIHPGVINTNLISGPISNYGLWLIEYPLRAFGWLFLGSVANGARNQTWAAVAPLAKTDIDEGVRSGTFYFPVGISGKGTALTTDEKLTKELWEWTEKELEGHGLE